MYLCLDHLNLGQFTFFNYYFKKFFYWLLKATKHLDGILNREGKNEKNHMGVSSFLF